VKVKPGSQSKEPIMAVYIVAYDLNKPNKDYRPLITALEGMTHCKPQKSLWFIQSSGTVKALRDLLSAYLDSDDTLLVSLVTKDAWASSNMANCAKWLQAKGL
jgi:hypothetical protein